MTTDRQTATLRYEISAAQEPKTRTTLSRLVDC
jgi:hypothetical protein